MNRLVHPGTKFINAQNYREVALADMTPNQQLSVWRYMHADGEGIWGHYPSVEAAVEKLGDVKFGVGSFDNDDTMKRAFVASLPNEIEVDVDDPIGYFNGRFVGHECEAAPIPVFLGNADNAPHCGLLDDGYNEFYDHWVKQPQTEFVCCLPSWGLVEDERGGQ